MSLLPEINEHCHFCSFLGKATLWNRHSEIFWPLACVGLQLGSEITCLFDRLLVIPASASLVILYEMNPVNGEFFFIYMEIVNECVGAFHTVVICFIICVKKSFKMLSIINNWCNFFKSLPCSDIPLKNEGSQIEIGQLHCHYSLSNLYHLLQDRMNLDLPCYFWKVCHKWILHFLE